MAKDFSVAILTLAENGKLKALEEIWLTPSKECSNNSPEETESLTLDKIWGLYLICAATSTICLLLALLQKYFHNHKNFEDEAHQLPQGNVIAESDHNNNVLMRALRNDTGLYIGNLKPLNNAATFCGCAIQCVHRRNSPRLESVRISDQPGNLQRSQSS